MRALVRLLPPLVVLVSGGCAQRSLTITSEPPGALVYLNGPEEIGRTPLRYDFERYGDYEIILRKEGYQTLRTNRNLKAPLYAFPPLDLGAEMIGVRDNRHWHFELTPLDPAPVDAQALIGRAQELKGQLRSTQYTRPPATAPATGE